MSDLDSLPACLDEPCVADEVYNHCNRTLLNGLLLLLQDQAAQHLIVFVDLDSMLIYIVSFENAQWIIILDEMPASFGHVHTACKIQKDHLQRARKRIPVANQLFRVALDEKD